MFDTASQQRLAEDTAVERGRILQSTGLQRAGTFFAFVRKDDLVVKLPAGRVRELLASGAG